MVQSGQSQAPENPNPQSDPSQAFLQRLMEALRQGERLDDPRDTRVLQRWAEIVRGLPESAILRIIPTTIRTLFRNSEIAPMLAQCGLDEHRAMQHEAIAAYVVSYRRFEKSRQSPESEESAVIGQLREELRDLNEKFQEVLDQALAAAAERDRLAEENASLQQQVLAQKMEKNQARRRLSDARSRTFKQFRLHLFMLKEECQRRANDPRRLMTAEVSVESFWATLEALGWSEEAAQTARLILGDDLFELYFGRDAEEVPADDPLKPQPPDPDLEKPADDAEPAGETVTLPEPGLEPPGPGPEPAAEEAQAPEEASEEAPEAAPAEAGPTLGDAILGAVPEVQEAVEAREAAAAEPEPEPAEPAVEEPPPDEPATLGEALFGTGGEEDDGERRGQRGEKVADPDESLGDVMPDHLYEAVFGRRR